MLYKVHFKDGTEFVSNGNYTDTKWKDVPDKEIRSINIVLPDGNILTLHGCEAYNYIVEGTQDFYGSNKFTLCYQYLMGRIGNKVMSYRITLFQSKDSRYKLGDITRRVYEFGKEDNGKPSRGWKKGILR